MKKRIIALLICIAVSVSVFSGCAGSIDADSEYKGQQINMYLSENIYNLDPAYAYTNESSRSIVNLIFDTLFSLDKNGKVQPSLAKSYRTEKNKDGNYLMYIEIKDDAKWSDNQPVTADDVVFAWKRLLNPNNSFSSAYLLFDVKGARAYNMAEISKDDIGLSADGKLLTIEFEKNDAEPNYNQFLLNLTSLALAPLREDIASKNDDWAKKPGIMTASGPFKLTKVGFYKNGEITYEDINYSVKVVDENNKVVLDKNGNPVYKNASEPGSFTEQRISSFILERNAYYYRNAEDDEKLDVSVTPYRIIVDCSLNDNEILEAYNDGIITYVGDIPLSLRNDVSDKATKYNSLSTNLLYLNQNAEITRKYEKDGETVTEKVKLFSDEYVKVRQALSMAIDRDAIVKKVVFAEPATGIVPTGVFDTNSADKLFRDSSSETGTNLKYNKDKAAGLLKEANVVPSEYSFSVTVAAYDEVHLAIADIVIEAWKELGFNVSLNTRGTVPNNDYHKDVAGIPTDLCDDLWAEDIKNGQYEVALLDLVATSADSMSVLAPFARQFAGERMDMSNPANYELAPHSTGYDSDDYNDLIEKIFTNQNIASRSEDLHKAEDMLMNDMPVIPLVFNQGAYLLNEDVLDLNNKVLFWETSSEYYYPVCFDKISVKDYDEYELACAKYVYDNFDEWKTRSNSYFATNFTNISKESFVYTNSNYYYLFKNKYGTANYDWIPSKPEK
jgi:ABC-type oligopeptide transport system substrate-binding subunit